MFSVLASLYTDEAQLYLSHLLAEEQCENAPVLHSTIADPHNEDRLVVVSSSLQPTLVGGAPHDPTLGVTAPATFWGVQRKAEYCQWQEEKTVKWYFWTSYTYTKAWLPRCINSSAFASKEHFNPTYDPAPPATLLSGAEVDLSGGAKGGLHVSPFDLTPAMGARVWLTLEDPPPQANALGFVQAPGDYHYYYARYASNAPLSTSNDCAVGDVRIHYEAYELPQKGMTIFALQHGTSLRRRKFGSPAATLQDAYYVKQGIIPKDALCKDMAKEQRDVASARSGPGISVHVDCLHHIPVDTLTIIGFFLLGYPVAYWLSKDGAFSYLDMAAVGAWLYLTELTLIWYHFYGVNDIGASGALALVSLAAVVYLLDLLPCKEKSLNKVSTD